MVELIKLWFNRAVPNPTPKNQAVQYGCHLEEITEMMDQIDDELSVEVQLDAEYYKKHAEFVDVKDKKALLDALCDQIVTAVGVAHMFGMDIEGALQEVNRSNWSKFDSDGQPVFDKHGKIKKGPNYSPPDLSRFI